MIPLHCFKYDNPIIDTINKLIKILYEDLDNSAGGPLHIIADDGNYRDHDLDFFVKNNVMKIVMGTMMKLLFM